MIVTLQKWGNSSGIRIPKQILIDLDIKINDELSIRSFNDEIIVKKEFRYRTLQNYLEDFYKTPITKIFNVDEIDTEFNLGDEIW